MHQLESRYDLIRQVFSVDRSHSTRDMLLSSVECQSGRQNYAHGAEIQRQPGSEFH